MFVLRVVVHKNRNRKKKCERTTECYTEFNAQFMYSSVHNFSCGYFNMVNTMFVLKHFGMQNIVIAMLFSFNSIYNVSLYTVKKMEWKLGVCSPQSNRVALFGSNTIKSIVDRFSRTIRFKCVCEWVYVVGLHTRGLLMKFVSSDISFWFCSLRFSFSSQSSKFSRENKENFLNKKEHFLQKCIVRNWHF